MVNIGLVIAVASVGVLAAACWAAASAVEQLPGSGGSEDGRRRKTRSPARTSFTCMRPLDIGAPIDATHLLLLP